MNNQYLLDLARSISERQAFFGLWIAIVIGFALLMIRHYRKQTRRNFKD